MLSLTKQDSLGWKLKLRINRSFALILLKLVRIELLPLQILNVTRAHKAWISIILYRLISGTWALYNNNNDILTL